MFLPSALSLSYLPSSSRRPEFPDGVSNKRGPADLQEAVKPHLIAVQVAVKDLIGALLALAPKPPAGDEAK